MERSFEWFLSNWDNGFNGNLVLLRFQEEVGVRPFGLQGKDIYCFFIIAIYLLIAALGENGSDRFPVMRAVSEAPSL